MSKFETLHDIKRYLENILNNLSPRYVDESDIQEWLADKRNFDYLSERAEILLEKLEEEF
jgi:hypothetical protein